MSDPLPALYLDRDRAESFGAAADQYDRFRPGYPDALIDDLAGLGPASVLDVGCGTGKVGAALAARGLPVLGLEPDPRMAAVARRHGLAVEVSTFEDWDPAGRSFGLVTCGDAWHWIDPARGLAKVAEVLAEGGLAARFWSTVTVDEAVAAALDPVYRELAPDVAQVWSPANRRVRPDAVDMAADVFEQSPAFSAVEVRSYGFERGFAVDEWLGLAATFSDHRRLGPGRLGVLLAAVRAELDELGFAAHIETTAFLAQRL